MCDTYASVHDSMSRVSRRCSDQSCLQGHTCDMHTCDRDQGILVMMNLRMTTYRSPS